MNTATPAPRSMEDLTAVYQALDRVQAIIEFELNGTIITANQNFLDLFGYDLADIAGKSHAMFCDPDYAESSDYVEFWDRLRRGEYFCQEFKRLTNGGGEVWLRASYNPVFNAEGVPIKVVKFATDITEEKRRSAKLDSIIQALDRSQAVAEFDIEGNITDAKQKPGVNTCHG